MHFLAGSACVCVFILVCCVHIAGSVCVCIYIGVLCTYCDHLLFVLQPWPLNGGKWGEEVPHSTTDIIVTGYSVCVMCVCL